MSIDFNNLLVPVDFSANTDLAVKKAIALMGADKPVLHLVHVVYSRATSAALAAKSDLEGLAYRIGKTRPEICIRTQVLKGRSLQRTIMEYASALTPDLIVIGKQNGRRRWGSFHPKHRFFSGKISPDLLAQKTNCPVLTAKPGSEDGRTRIIVMPIRNFLPERKLAWAIALARKFRAQVHLLALHGQRQDERLPQVFLTAYHFLREHLRHPIEFSTVDGRDLARATLIYAELVMADLILVNPMTESGVWGVTGSRHISDLLSRNSKIQVLDIEPLKKEI